ncbi:hypothetical protein [Streptomyces sp. N50]|uniref:hypothetical protein n=1 Tax=Streptomyces sp. N50 TaxID=3081765 RepID=UPI0029623FD1|nr:hypothetical protein [Streptomyces sp. N50]WOX07450.1 hypothetical protein R2B38_00605 [Streptomyces sp. N50]
MQEGFYLQPAQENSGPKHSFGGHGVPRKKWHQGAGYLAPNIALLAIEIIFGTSANLSGIRVFGASGIPLGILLCLTQMATLLATLHRLDRRSRREEATW